MIARTSLTVRVPGYREEYGPEYYASFVFGLDGHNIEAVWYDYGRAK